MSRKKGEAWQALRITKVAGNLMSKRKDLPGGRRTKPKIGKQGLLLKRNLHEVRRRTERTCNRRKEKPYDSCLLVQAQEKLERRNREAAQLRGTHRAAKAEGAVNFERV